MTYNSNMFEAGRGSIYKSPPKSSSNANKQAAGSMKSAGIGGIGGKPTTSSAKKIQDQFRRETQRDDDRRGLGASPKVTPTPQKSFLESLYDRVRGSITFAGGDPDRKKRPTPNPGALYTASPFIIPAATAVTASVLGPGVDYTDPTEVPRGMPSIYTPDSRDFGKNIGTMPAADKPASAKIDMSDLLNLKEKVVFRDAPGLMASPSMSKPSTPDMSDAINRTLASIKASDPDVPYVIQAGDTLSEIAVQTGTTVEDLVRENKIEDKERIYTGDELKIPSTKSTKTKEDIVSSLIQGYERKKDMSGTQVASSGEIRSDAFSGDAITDTLKSLERQIPERDTDLDPMSAQEASFDRKGIMSPTSFKSQNNNVDAIKASKAEIKEVQKLLGVTADGIIGRNSKRALASFQYKAGLPVSGEMDPSTIKALKKPDSTDPRNAKPRIDVLNESGNAPDISKVKEWAKTNIADPLKAAAFVATVEAETGGRNLIEQGRIYSRALGRNRTPSEIATLLGGNAARQQAFNNLANNPDYLNGSSVTKNDMVFDIFYDDQYRSRRFKLGNDKPSDGSKYKGRGLVQITGKKNYKDIGDIIGVDLVANPELVNDPQYAAAASMAYLSLPGKDFFAKDVTQASLAKTVGHSGGTAEARERFDRAKEIKEEMYP